MNAKEQLAARIATLEQFTIVSIAQQFEVAHNEVLDLATAKSKAKVLATQNNAKVRLAHTIARQTAMAESRLAKLQELKSSGAMPVKSTLSRIMGNAVALARRFGDTTQGVVISKEFASLKISKVGDQLFATLTIDNVEIFNVSIMDDVNKNDRLMGKMLLDAAYPVVKK